MTVVPIVTWADVRVAGTTYYIDGHPIIIDGLIPLALLADWTRGDLIIGGATEWIDYAHPGATYHLQTDANDVVWAQDITIADGSAIGQVAGPLVRFDDSNNFLEITGCDVGIGTATPSHKLTLESAVSGEPDIWLENTNADEDSMAIFFYKNSASPAQGDELGELQFWGNNSDISRDINVKIEALTQDVTPGDEAAGISIECSMAGTVRNFLQLSGYNGTTDEGEVIINEDAQDVDFRVEALGVTDALEVRGSDGQITLGVLGAGHMSTDAGGVVASTTNIVMADGATIGQAAGPLVEFDDTNNYLEITNCKVGIGTTEPDWQLVVSGNAVIVRTLIENTSNTAVATFNVANSDNDRFIMAAYGRNAVGNRHGIARAGSLFVAANTGNAGSMLSIGTDSNHDVSFATNNIQRVLIDTSGNVGINEASPAISDGVGLHIGGKILRLDTSKTPANAGDTGNVGEICWDSSFIYVCVATDTWERAAIASW